MPRIISGHIATDGSIVSGSGNFKVSVDSAHEYYAVTFTVPFTTYANVVTTGVVEDQNPATVHLLESSTLGFKVIPLYINGGGWITSPFHFIAVGE